MHTHMPHTKKKLTYGVDEFLQLFFEMNSNNLNSYNEDFSHRRKKFKVRFLKSFVKKKVYLDCKCKDQKDNLYL